MQCQRQAQQKSCKNNGRFNCVKTIRGQTEMRNQHSHSAIQWLYWSQRIEVNSEITMRMPCPRVSMRLNFPILKLSLKHWSWNILKIHICSEYLKVRYPWKTDAVNLLLHDRSTCMTWPQHTQPQPYGSGQLCCSYCACTCCIHINDDANSFRSVCNLRQFCGSQSQSIKPGNICRAFSGPLDALCVMDLLVAPFSTDMLCVCINKYFVSFLFWSQILPINFSIYRAPLWPQKVFRSLQTGISAFFPLPLANVRQWDHLVQILLTMINGFD